MAFWEELGKTITDKGKEATKKAKELTEVIQLKSQIAAEKTKISEGYAAIGKLYYEETKDSCKERYQEAFSWVEDSLNRLSVFEEQLSQLEGTRVCAECGCKVAKEDLFCRRCGAPMAPVKEDFEPAADPEETETIWEADENPQPSEPIEPAKAEESEETDENSSGTVIEEDL